MERAGARRPPPPLASASSFHSVRDVSAAASPLPTALPLNDDGIWDRPLRVLLTSASHGGAHRSALCPHSPESSPAPVRRTSALARGADRRDLKRGTKSPIGFNSDITKHHDARREEEKKTTPMVQRKTFPPGPCLARSIKKPEGCERRTDPGRQVTTACPWITRVAVATPAPTAASKGMISSSSRAARPVASSSIAAWTARGPIASSTRRHAGSGAAELKDEQLYSQRQERPEGDFCPICTLPIPVPMGDHSVFNVCCMKRICYGCDFAAKRRGMFDCPFCRTRYPDNDADTLAMVMARVGKKDPEAIFVLGQKYFYGILGFQMDMRKAAELWTEAAELGSINALYSLGNAYDLGEGIQQDKAKAAEFYKKAAMQGHTQSRHNLGYLEALGGNSDRAVRHFLISAKMGHDYSLENIKLAFNAGLATKEQYAEALKGYQDAVEEMKSHDRDEAKRLRV
ncbi:hypothetical protein THAOC_27883 [Thalassiosira oceanica]|uniref:RING-type domain-containing protein n=1 Tax=Thalassiosira oceanica TaxID=159749 RepID=K0RKI3_THAOC|nr:hypothetical protein THAOC_27883 [Thalassiosira oceanica]|eukprot:EJK52809.1 hypothetical protein THAOC_27883 [Thalassiosira oceanica]